MKNSFQNFKFDRSGKSLALFPKKNIEINYKLFQKLKILSKKNNNENVRICLHKSKREKLHNMIIFMNKKNPHIIDKHNLTDEIYHLIDGILKVKIFNRKKILIKTIKLSKKNPIFRMRKKVFHQTIPVSNHVIFHECRLSPYNN